jgi:hypothetical protein
LLRRVVQCALDGHTENLKERTLGIEVFGRDADYDTNLDPVVRTAAGEVRKRIAQYYHADGHEHELRIDLPAGSYVPEFRFPVTEAPHHAVPTPMPHPEELEVSKRSRGAHWAFIVVVACLVLLLIAGAGFVARPMSATQKFWGPVLATSAPALITLGDPSYGAQVDQPPRSTPVSQETTLLQHYSDMERAVFSDVVSMAQIGALLGRAEKVISVRDSVSTNFSDLQRGPNVLISGFDNPWTLRAVERLRFRFVRDGHRLARIEDTKNSQAHDWLVDFSAPYSRLTQDYAIVGRFQDATTGQMTVIAAGIGENGTIAAGEFLTNPGYLETINGMAPKNWGHKNFEAVIATQVIDGRSGPPRLLASETW